MAVFLGIVAYIGLCMGVRTFLHRRATGRSGFLGISGRPGSVEWWAGVSFVLALLLLAVAPLSGAPLLVVPRPYLDLLGALSVCVGAIGTWWSQSAMGNSWRIGVAEAERTKLVTRGPFARVRNPIFSFMLLAAFGACLLLPNVIAIAGGIVLYVAIDLQVRRVEEPYLGRVHGEAYREYRARTGRFLPRVF